MSSENQSMKEEAGNDIDQFDLVSLLSAGNPLEDIKKGLSTNIKSLEYEIDRLSKEQELLLNYRGVQALRLTKLQHEILLNITEDKIVDAPLRDLVNAFKVLKEKELLSDGKPTEIRGLIGYLVQLEKELEEEEEASSEDVQEATFTEEPAPQQDPTLPNI